MGNGNIPSYHVTAYVYYICCCRLVQRIKFTAIHGHLTQGIEQCSCNNNDHHKVLAGATS